MQDGRQNFTINISPLTLGDQDISICFLTRKRDCTEPKTFGTVASGKFWMRGRVRQFFIYKTSSNDWLMAAIKIRFGNTALFSENRIHQSFFHLPPLTICMMVPNTYFNGHYYKRSRLFQKKILMFIDTTYKRESAGEVGSWVKTSTGKGFKLCRKYKLLWMCCNLFIMIR